MKFTKATTADLRCPPDRAEAMVYDETLPGFGLRLNRGGRATWFVQYRIGTKQRRVSLGTRATVSADEARKLAKAALGDVAKGSDPQEKRHTAKAQAAVTFGSVVPRYLAYAQSRQRPRHHSHTKRYLERYWTPLDKMGINSIKRADVSAQITKIAEVHGDHTANRARSALSSFFTWGMGDGVAESNPVTGTHKAIEEKARDRVLTDVEVAAAWQLSGTRDFGSIVRLLILTGQRREEVGSIGWSEIDRANALWTLPASRSKNGKPHVVPLAPAALAILDAIPQRVGRDLIFGSAAGGFKGYGANKLTLDKAMAASLKANLPWRIHDLRRTAATGMGDLGVQPHVVEAVLNHASGSKAGVAGTYNRSLYAAEKRAALDLWAEHVMSLVSEKGD